MISPTDFLTVANNLASYSDEANLRTSIGRYYYASFLATRSKMTLEGVIFAREGTDHKEARRALKRRRGLSFASKLGALHKLRKQSDYEIHRNMLSSDCIHASKLAKDIFSCL